MPIYPWIDNRSKKEVDVIRNFDLYETPPTREEAKELTDEEFAAAEWERLIGASKWIRGWSGGKGNW